MISLKNKILIFSLKIDDLINYVIKKTKTPKYNVDILIVLSIMIIDHRKKNRSTRITPFFSCSFEPNEANSNECHLRYMLHSLANPFCSLLKVFNVLSLPSNLVITKQLINFVTRCMQQYKKYDKLDQFEEDFFLNQSENAELKKQIKNIVELKEKNKLEQYDLSKHSSASDGYPEALKQSSCLQELVQISKDNLLKYKIVPRSVKLNTLEQMSKRLEWSQFKSKIIIDKNNQKVQLQIPVRGQVQKIMTLEQLFHAQWKVNLDNNIIENISQSLMAQIFEFYRCFNKFPFLQKKSNAFFKVHPKNILIYVKEESFNNIKLSQQPAIIDLASVLLDQMGLVERPSSIEQLLTSYGLSSPLNQFDFASIISEMSPLTIKDKRIQQQIQPIVHWLLVSDFLYTAFLTKDKISMYETNISSQGAFKAILSKSEQYLNGYTVFLMMLFEMQYCLSKDEVWAYTFEKWERVIKQLNQQDKQFAEMKFEEARMILANMLLLFYDQEKPRIKYIIEKNSQFSKIESVGRYIMLYLLTMYPLLQLEINLVRLGYKGEDILKDKKYGIKHNYQKLNNLAGRFVKRIYEYKKRPSNDPNSKFMDNNFELMQVYEQVQTIKICCCNQPLVSYHKQNRINQIQLLQKKIQKIIYIMIYFPSIESYNKSAKDVKKQQFPSRQFYRKFFDASSKNKWLSSPYLQLCKFQFFLDFYFDFRLQMNAIYQTKLSKFYEVQDNLKDKSKDFIDKQFQRIRQDSIIKTIYNIINIIKQENHDTQEMIPAQRIQNDTFMCK